MTKPRRDGRHGSEASDKYIRHAVLKGRLVSATPHGGQELLGYICGLDDYKVVFIPRNNPDQRILLPKGSTTLAIHQSTTLDAEPDDVRAEIERATESFRRHIQQQQNNK